MNEKPASENWNTAALLASARERPAWRLVASYVLGLTLVAAFTVGAHVRVTHALADQESDARVVSLAGRQRALGQRMTRLVLSIATQRADSAGLGPRVEQLDQDVRAFAAGQAALLGGDAAMKVPRIGDARAGELLRTAARAGDRILSAAGGVSDGSEAAGAIGQLRGAVAEYQTSQGDAIRRLEEWSAEKVVRMLRDQTVLLWSTLALLLLEAVFIFQPAARAIRRQLRLLRDAGALMTHEARHDALTGLPNRAALMIHIDELLAECIDAPDTNFGLYFTDFDGFKAVNDSLGHACGDQLLVEIARRIASLGDELPDGELRGFRLSGDEFVMTYRCTDAGPAVRTLAARAVSRFAEPHDLGGESCVSTASIGVVVASELREGQEHAVTASDLLRHADLAMLQAKAAGKGRYTVYDTAMYRHARRRRRIEDHLSVALASDALQIQYQGIFAAAGGRPVAVEALLAWWHPELGEINAREMIEIADESGMIQDLSGWVFERAARDFCGLEDGVRPARLHLNVSRGESSHPGFVDRVADLLKRYPRLDGRLCLEFAEGGLVRGREQFGEMLRAVSAIGVATCIDDLSGGDATLGDLAGFAIDRIKINPNLLDLRQGAEVGETSPRVAEAVVAFARTAGLSVIAFGVESAGAMDASVALGADEVQGYFLGRPASLAEAMGLGDDHRPRGVA